MRHIRALILSLGVLLIAAQPVHAHHGHTSILVLHSYDPELHWTAEINQAIKETVLAHDPEASLHVEYLDTKRNPSQSYTQHYLDEILPQKLAGLHFEVVLTSDNDAFNFLRRHRVDLFSGTPAVFCGVNGFSPTMLENQGEVTGVTETLDIRETAELALRLHPQKRELIIVGETATETGRKIDADIRTALGGLPREVKLRYWNDQPLETLAQRLAADDPEAIYLLVSVLHDRSGRIYSYAESAHKLRKLAKGPIYGVWDFLLGNGIVGGKLTSARAQGKLAAEMALQLAEGTRAASIPIVHGEANRYMFDDRELRRFDIAASLLPAGSIIINQPPGYYRLDKWQFWVGVVIILLLCMTLFLLLRTVTLRRKNELALAERARLASIDAEIGQTLTRGAPLRETLQKCLETLIRHTDTVFARIWTVSEDDRTLLELQASAGLYTHIDGKHRLKRFGELKVGRIASEQLPLLTNQVSGEAQFVDQDWVKREKIVGFAGFPLILKGVTVGVIAFFSRRPIQPEIHKTMASVADMLAVGIERHRTEQALHQALLAAEDGREKMDAILRSVTDGLLVADLDSRVVLINQAAEKMFGVSLEAAHGHPLAEVFGAHPAFRQLQRLFSGEGEDAEVDLRGDVARTLRVTTGAVHRRDGSLGGTVALIHDVTRERELDRMKSEFIATAAHELRTPITTIRGYAELLAGEPAESPFDATTRQEFLRYILDKTDTLEKLIDDLLDLGRVESGRIVLLDKQECEMVTLVKEIVQHHQQETTKHRFEMQCPLSHLVMELDRVKIESVLDNLIGNAVKYSPQGGTIRISGELEDGMLRVCIADEGIGLSEEQLAQAFNKFYRGDPSDSATRGLGLGLTICKGIIEAHGGRIWLESEPGKGTRACFTLPLPKAELPN